MTIEKIGSDGYINAVSPLDARVIGRVACTTVSQLPERISEARDAQEKWQSVSLDERATVLSGLSRALADHADDLVEVLREEIGRHPTESWFAEIVPNIELVKWWTKIGLKSIQSQQVKLNPINFPQKKARVESIPRGVLGLITPWNYPVSIALRALVPALLSGNAVIWKPSEYAALSGEKLGGIVKGIVPEGLLQVVQGDGVLGAAVVEQVDGIGFTGSFAAGKKVAVQAAERLIPSSLELGGKDFAVVLPDANLERAAAGIVWGALTNAGQNCASVEIVAVHDSVVPRFTDLLREEVKKMTPYVGPLVNEAQKTKVTQQLDDALAQGALVLEGGMAPAEGLRIDPTLVERVPWDCSLIQEETFGPVIPIMTFSELNEIDQRLHACDFGLTLSLWTKDIKAAESWLVGKPVGVVTVNNHSFTAGIAPLPWTGVKGSGLGVTNGIHALEWMIRPQAVLIDRSGAREPWWHPFNDAALSLARAIADLNTGRRGLSALKDLIMGFLKRWK